MMAKRPTPDANALTTWERILLFCIASGTNWQWAGITGEVVTALIVRGFLVRDATGHLALTDNGQAALRAHCCRGCDVRISVLMACAATHAARRGA
jgi:hypothetical protein